MLLNKRRSMNPFTHENVKSEIDKLKKKKMTNWVILKNRQYHSKVLLNSFPMNAKETDAASVGN